MDLLKKHTIYLKHSDVEFPKISAQISSEICKPNFQVDLYKLLKRYKDQIEIIPNQKIWDFCKKLTNEFEMIHLSSKGRGQVVNIGVANYEPISRSYFKMWEMIKDFNIIDFSKKRLVIVGIAEGPGGFIECIYNMRKHYTDNYDDRCVCITLKSYKHEIPGWKKSGRLFKENPNIDIYYGEDDTGDLYKKKNIEGLSNYIGEDKADIVTADGGFDYSIDYNKQEQLSYRLLFCEIVTALSTLKKGGVFILKIFDCFTEFTVKLHYFLSIVFNGGLLITKPFTSRPANSEKYIICKDFSGISKENLQKLYSAVEDWEILDNQNKHVSDLFDFKVPNEFYKAIEAYNIYTCGKQIKNILKTLTFIKLNLENNHINMIKQNQAIISSLWCKKYDVPINYRCKFLKDNIEHYNYIPNFIN